MKKKPTNIKTNKTDKDKKTHKPPAQTKNILSLVVAKANTILYGFDPMPALNLFRIRLNVSRNVFWLPGLSVF